MVNLGDVSYFEALQDALIASKNEIEIYKIDINSPLNQVETQIEKIISNYSLNEEKICCFSVGEKGIQCLASLSSLKKQNRNIKMAAAVHQYFDVIHELLIKDKLDFLAIPSSALNNAQKKEFAFVKNCSFYFTLGVGTKNPSLLELKKSYEGWNCKNKPTVNEPSIVVMLPGDAPAPDGTIKLFSKKSADKLFEAIHAIWQHEGSIHKIIVQNSPRTGKFDINGKIVCAHEYAQGDSPTIAEDKISAYFISLLQQAQLPYTFFNFTFEIDGATRKANSVYNQLLFLAQSNNKNYFIVPGESISMLSQIPLYLEPSRIVVFKPSSMNEQHEAIFSEASSRGYYQYFNEQGIIQTSSLPVKRTKDDYREILDRLCYLGNYVPQESKELCLSKLEHR